MKAMMVLIITEIIIGFFLALSNSPAESFAIVFFVGALGTYIMDVQSDEKFCNYLKKRFFNG